MSTGATNAADEGSHASVTGDSAGVPQDEPLPRHLILIASSAGGLRAMQRLFRQLPADLDAAVVVTQHLPPWH